MGNLAIPTLIPIIGAAAVGALIFFATKGTGKPSPKNNGNNTVNPKVTAAENNDNTEATLDSSSGNSPIKTKINIPSDDDQSEAADIIDNKNSLNTGNNGLENSPSKEGNKSALSSDNTLLVTTKKDQEKNVLLSVPSKKKNTSKPDNANIAHPGTAPHKNNVSSAMVNPASTLDADIVLPENQEPIITTFGQDYDDSDNSDPKETIDWNAASAMMDKAIPKPRYERDGRGYIREICPRLACYEGGSSKFPELLSLNSDDNWGYLYLSAQYLNDKHYTKCVEYAGLAISASLLVVRDLVDIVSCLKLKDFPDTTEFPRDNRYAYFYDIHTKDKIDVIDTITQDTRNISDEFLERLGMYIKITKPNSDDFTIFKVPFKNSLQKKIVIRYLQANLTRYVSSLLYPTGL